MPVLWVLSILLSAICFSVDINAMRDCPMAECEACLPLSIHDAPGVGFDLTAAYGTSTVRFYNGSTTDLAKVMADPAYVELMLRLHQLPIPPPLSQGQLLKRWLNKRLGRPATPDVGILGSFIQQLSRTSTVMLHDRIDRVVMTAPPFPALTHQDINDAMEYAGVHSWLTLPFPYPRRLSSSRAAFAAHGYGLCHDYKDLYNCEDEEDEMPLETVYFVSFTRHALYSSIDKYRSAYGSDSRSETYIFDQKAGLDSLPQYPSASAFWSYVGDKLAILPRESRSLPTRLLLGGENATDPEFLRVLMDVLGQTPAQVLNIFGGPNNTGSLEGFDGEVFHDPLFASARGAALYARRRQEAPFDCLERDECERERQRQRESKSTALGKTELK